MEQLEKSTTNARVYSVLRGLRSELRCCRWDMYESVWGVCVEMEMMRMDLVYDVLACGMGCVEGRNGGRFGWTGSSAVEFPGSRAY